MTTLSDLLLRSAPLPKREKATCGARTRKGTPCRRRPLSNGRCKLHGGLSTGPRTRRGRARALANLKQYR